MKILRRDGQKVLEAPINTDIVVFNNKLVIDLITVDKGTKYLFLLDAADIAGLREIFLNLEPYMTENIS